MEEEVMPIYVCMSKRTSVYVRPIVIRKLIYIRIHINTSHYLFIYDFHT
jgi:hypothetical protein